MAVADLALGEAGIAKPFQNPLQIHRGQLAIAAPFECGAGRAGIGAGAGGPGGKLVHAD